MKIRILRITVLLFSAIVLFGCETTAPTGLRTKSGDVLTDPQLVTLTTERNEILRAIFCVPGGSGKRPAVIFNHGTDVRTLGYEEAKRLGMTNVDDYVKALNEQGYVVIAPLRTLLAKEATLVGGRLIGTSEQWDQVIEYGLRSVAAARLYLANRADVDSSAIAIMGYSEGGNVALWSAIENPGYRAVVLLSPAGISTSTRYNLPAAAREDRVQQIGAPVFLAVAKNDFDAIRKFTREALIPNLQKVNPTFSFRADYPGDHSWFQKVRPEFWKDITAFLGQHLP